MSATLDATPIFAGGRDFYVPTFQVKLRGRPLGQDVVRDIVQISYKDSLTDIDSFEISINNWDAAKRQFKYTDLDLFDPGKQLELWMGYHGRDPLRLMISGEITSLRPNYPATGQPTLAVSGLNLLHRLRVKQESFTYENMTETEIATQVAARLGFKLLPDPPPAGESKNAFVFQYDEYDIIFLMERARRVGYDIYVKEIEQNGKAESRLFFGPSDTSRRPTYELVLGKSLVDFQPELTTHRQVGKVTVRGWDAVKKEKIEVTVKRSELTEDGLNNEGGLEAVVQSFGDREEIVADEPVPNADEARKKAISKFKEIARNMVTGNGSTLGLPDLRAGSHVFIDKLGDRFKGNYFVTATTHTISDGGYVTGFECRREEPKK